MAETIPLPVERLYLRDGQVVDLATPRSLHYVEGRSLTGIERTPTMGDVSRTFNLLDIEKRCTIGIDPDGQIVELWDAPLPSEWLS